MKAVDDSPLAALGFDAECQLLYAVVLRNPRSSPETLAWESGLEPGRLEQALATLRDASLVAGEDQIVALPPQAAIERIVVKRAAELRAERERLEDVRRELPAFAAQHRDVLSLGDEAVTGEVIRGRDLVPNLRELAASAPGELLWLRPDQWRHEDGRKADAVIQELLAAGRRSRVIYPARVLEEAPAVVRDRARLGEQVRVLATLPTRLAVLGSAVAIVPQRLGTDAERVLLLRQEAVVGVLRLWFDSLWEKALPIPGLDGSAQPDRLGGQRLLLEQLAVGAKDEQIARALGMSLRTVRRRVAELMESLGVDSRFAAGAEAVRRGWL